MHSYSSLARPHRQPFPRRFAMKYSHIIVTLIIPMVMSTLSLNLNRPNWGLSFEHQENSPDISLDEIPSLRQNSFLEDGRKRKYRQMSIDNNIEILKAKLINSLLVRRQQNQAKSFLQYIFFLEHIFSSFVPVPYHLMFSCWDRLIVILNTNLIFSDFVFIQ